MTSLLDQLQAEKETYDRILRSNIAMRESAMSSTGYPRDLREIVLRHAGDNIDSCHFLIAETDRKIVAAHLEAFK